MTRDPSLWREAFDRHLAWTSDAPIGVVVERAEGAWLVAPDGTRYLDLLSGIGVANVGHAHPEVLRAVERQNRRHHHVMVYGEYVQEAQALYARELADVLPEGLDRVYFVSTGAEAIEGALKLARKVTGRPGFVSFEGAYHGDTLAALSLAGNPAYREPFEPLPGPVRRLPYGESAALEAIDETVAAVVVEPVQGEGGVRVPPPEFLPALRRRCTGTGALLVYDEVMTGFGRTGRLFAAGAGGTVPDVLVLAKALGGGLPLGAFVSSAERMEALAHDPPLSHVTTFGGHPLSCAAGRASLQVLRRERLAERAATVGERWRARLKAEMRAEDGVREVRGVGLMVGVELADASLTRRFVERCRDEGILLGWTLHQDRVLRLTPPLVTPEETLEEAAVRMGRILRAVG